MFFDYFDSDMAVEAASQGEFEGILKSDELHFGIVRRRLNVNNSELETRLNRRRGVYITYDCPSQIYESENSIRALEGHIATTLKNLIGANRKSVLVIGLGNGMVSADALGRKVVEGIEVSREHYPKTRICAIRTEVPATTGIQSAEIALAVTQKVKPAAVILVDSLATSSVQRVGLSYQLTTAGISPGSGVGQDREQIDKNVLGVPVIGIGVPLMLSMRTAIYGFIREYESALGIEIDEFKLRSALLEKRLSNLVVAPKEIDYLVDASSAVISSAINRALR